MDDEVVTRTIRVRHTLRIQKGTEGTSVHDMGAKKVKIFTDSQLVASQVTNEYLGG